MTHVDQLEFIQDHFKGIGKESAIVGWLVSMRNLLKHLVLLFHHLQVGFSRCSFSKTILNEVHACHFELSSYYT